MEGEEEKIDKKNRIGESCEKLVTGTCNKHP